jgi:anti-sigma B factor antagonist
MKVTIEKSDGKCLVTLDGNLDSYVSEEAEQQFEKLYELENTEITLDCTNLEYIASSGLRLFFMLVRNVSPNGCKIIVKGAQKPVMEVFDMTGFSDFFTFV